MTEMKLTSPEFEHCGTIPAKFTCDGEDISPTLEIANAPDGTKTMVLIVDDPDSPSKTWLHWLVYGIAPASRIKENQVPGKQGMNDFGKKDYGGPCPHSGRHRYFFRLHALNVELNLPDGASRKDIEDAMQGHILDKTELMGLYERSR
jgi:Raf kinase inhibitor-like YbhB/YbcL family protein